MDSSCRQSRRPQTRAALQHASVPTRALASQTCVEKSRPEGQQGDSRARPARRIRTIFVITKLMPARSNVRALHIDRRGGGRRGIPMAKLDDMASARPMYLHGEKKNGQHSCITSRNDSRWACVCLAGARNTFAAEPRDAIYHTSPPTLWQMWQDGGRLESKG